jgi:hypothetical protein
MRSTLFFEKVVALVIFLGSAVPLYLVLKVVLLGATPYVAYFVFDFCGGTDVDAFRAGTTYMLLIGADYVGALLASVYLAKKIVEHARRSLFGASVWSPMPRALGSWGGF